MESEVLRACGRAALTDNGLCQPLSCCAALRVQDAASSTATTHVDYQMPLALGGRALDTDLTALHGKFLRIKVHTSAEPYTAVFL